MSDIFSDLIGDLHASFLQIYQAKPSSLPTVPVLAYEPIGIPISDAMFRLNPTDTTYNANLALERFSNMTNIIGVVTDGTFQDTGRKLDNMLEELALAPAMPASGFSADVLGKIKSDALKMFDSTLGSSVLGKDARFHATYPTPSNWYDPAAPGIWLPYPGVSKPATPPVGPRPAVPIAFQRGWQVLPPKLTPVVTHPSGTGGPVAKEMLAVRPAAQPVRLATGITGVGPRHLEFGVSASLATTSVVNPAMLRAPIAQIVTSPEQQRAILPERELSNVVLSNTTPQPVTTTKITVTFEYCVVTAERDWLSDAFLVSKGWYSPGLKAGDLSTGTLEDNTGLIPFLPLAMILIRNLTISGTWTTEDTTALSTAAALGPFNLMGRTINQQSSSLSCTGMQLLAWLCQVQPLLPPQSDPALVGASSTATSTPATPTTPAASVPATPVAAVPVS